MVTKTQFSIRILIHLWIVPSYQKAKAKENKLVTKFINAFPAEKLSTWNVKLLPELWKIKLYAIKWSLWGHMPYEMFHITYVYAKITMTAHIRNWWWIWDDDVKPAPYPMLNYFHHFNLSAAFHHLPPTHT